MQAPLRTTDRTVGIIAQLAKKGTKLPHPPTPQRLNRRSAGVGSSSDRRGLDRHNVLLRSLSMSTDLFGSVLHQLNSLLGAAELRHSAVRRHANDPRELPAVSQSRRLDRVASNRRLTSQQVANCKRHSTN
jgi:hypothetical protein